LLVFTTLRSCVMNRGAFFPIAPKAFDLACELVLEVFIWSFPFRFLFPIVPDGIRYTMPLDLPAIHGPPNVADGHSFHFALV